MSDANIWADAWGEQSKRRLFVIHDLGEGETE